MEGLWGILAIQALSLTAIDPGIELTFLDMPGCHAYDNLGSMPAMVISGTRQHQRLDAETRYCFFRQLSARAACPFSGSRSCHCS